VRKVLFVCVGNSCRSQMAEGFARTYGRDVIEAASAGLCAASAVAAETIQAMSEKNIDLSAYSPKSLRSLSTRTFDLAVNLSGFALPDVAAGEVIEWEIPDPVGCGIETHRQVRDQIENRVMGLILDLRRKTRSRSSAADP